MVERVSFSVWMRRESSLSEERALAKEEALFAANAPQPAKKQGRRGSTISLLSLMRQVKGRPRIWVIARLLSLSVTPSLHEEEEAPWEDAGDAQLRFLIKLRISCVLREE